MTTTFFYVWPLWCARSFSGCKRAYCHGTLLCQFSIPKCGGALGGNDQNRAEKQNVVLTWFRPVTRSSGHLGRRTKGGKSSTFLGKIRSIFWSKIRVKNSRSSGTFHSAAVKEDGSASFLTHSRYCCLLPCLFRLLSTPK